MNTNFNTTNLTKRQREWLKENNIVDCIQLYNKTISALAEWRESPQGSTQRSNAWTTYNHYCKKIFPKVNMKFYWENVH